ncbi:hypothetical protein HELRODRAFT_94572 [Helobdella robusta]|uniref:dihydropyrimidinase n=1 Tax=Helobdella robusta TaxID=6412 RepID=T1G918_HELRO|nr:hypothetical protein HELRODRAFT_94572 [Helobdella robusta]ESO02443.1 hypothetical protein HELRODRAFT_94572 [Helobdella robusta]
MLLIKGGKVVNADETFQADVFIEDGVIKAIGHDLVCPRETRVINADGLLVMPGGIDAHVHMQMPIFDSATVDDFYTGTRAALAGGTTMIIDFVVPKLGESLLAAYDRWRSWADGKVCCDYSLHVAITWWSDVVREEMGVLTKERGVNSFKTFMAYKGYLMLNDPELYAVFSRCKELGALAMVHAENGNFIEEKSKELLEMGIVGPEGHLMSRPEEIEGEATNRAVTLGGLINCPVYIVHVMSRSAADVIVQGLKRGVVVYGEPIGASLALTGHHCYHADWRHAAAYIMSPPIREDPSTPAYLMDLLACNLLHTTGSDHCACSVSQKARGYSNFTQMPNGVTGVEERMSIVWQKGVRTGKLTPNRFVEVTSTTNAKIFNVYPRKGRVSVGSDADLVLWDPSMVRVLSAKTHQTRVEINVFEGIECHGGPKYVIAGGKVVVDPEGLHVTAGAGRFVPNDCFSDFVYNRIEEREKLKVTKGVERSPPPKTA